MQRQKTSEALAGRDSFGRAVRRAKAIGRLRAHALLFVVVPLLALMGWWLMAAGGYVSAIFVPPPSKVWSTGVKIFQSGYRNRSIWEHIWISLSHVLYALGIVALVGVPVGWVMGMSRSVQSLFDPAIEFVRPLPPLAYLSLLILWFGIGETTQIVLLVVTGFPIMATSARSAASSVSIERLKTARAFGAGRLQIFRHVVMPSSLPEILTGMRVTLGILFATVVAAEMVAASMGLGWMILDASHFLRSDVIFVGIFIMAILGFGIDRLGRLVESWLVPWKGQE